MKILGISGSLREGSYNRKLLAAAARSLPVEVAFQIADIGSLPHYNEDLDTSEGLAAVSAFKSAVGAASGVLIATPEYNYGIPGPLKNALDWASRPAYMSVFARKKVAIMSASKGMSGGMRAQGQLKQVLLGMIAEVYPYPEFTLASAHTAFLESGLLAEPKTAERLERLVKGFVDWVR